MKGFRVLMRTLCSGLILLVLVRFSESSVSERVESFRDSVSDDPVLRSKFGESEVGGIPGVCRSCGCGSFRNLAAESFAMYTCMDCNGTRLESDCVYSGVTDESSEGNRTELIRGLHTSTFGEYKNLFYGKSDVLVNRKNRNNLLARIFEPEFVWQRLSYGSIRDNCIAYRDSEGDSDHFKLSYTYTLQGDKNCTELLVHFVNKHSGRTLYKNIRPFKGMNESHDVSSMMVFRHDDIEVGVDSFEKINLHQEFNLTFYDLPPKYLFSNEQQEWVPTGIQTPQIEIHPRIVHDRLILLFQLINSPKSSIPNCKLENIRVNALVQCRGVAFRPSPDYSRALVESKLREMRAKYRSKDLKLFLRKFEDKLKTVLGAIPNALLTSNNDDSRSNTPLSGLSIPCKEALYLNDIPKLMSTLNHSSIFSELAKSSSYISSMHILEDAEEAALLQKIENALGFARRTRGIERLVLDHPRGGSRSKKDPMARSDDRSHQDSSAVRSENQGTKHTKEEALPKKIVEESSVEYYERSARSASHFGKVYNGLYPVGPKLPSFCSSSKRSRFQSAYNEDEFSSSSASSSLVGSDDKMYIDFPIRNFWKIAKTPIDMESPQIGYCRGFYYRLLVHPRGGSCNDSESSYLSVFLEALYHESYPDDWIFPNVRFQLSVINFLDPKANITSWAHWTFSHDAMSRGWHKMVSHVRLTKAAGFVDDEGTVLIRGRAEPPFPRIWSRSPKCRPWSVWGTLPFRNASTLAQYKPYMTGIRQEQDLARFDQSISASNLCSFHQVAEESNQTTLSCRPDPSGRCGSSHPVEATLLIGSTPLSILDRLLWSSSNLFVPTLRPQLNLDFVPAFVHLLYHLKEFRRAVFSWNPHVTKKCASSQTNKASEKPKRPESPGNTGPAASSPSSQTSIIEALQRTFAYMTLWPIAYSIKRSIRHSWQERTSTDPSLINDWCFSRCCKCGGDMRACSSSLDTGSASEDALQVSSEKSNIPPSAHAAAECLRCKLPPLPDCSLIMKALYMNDLQKIDVSEPLIRFHCFIFGAIYLESAHAILQIAAHHRKSLPPNLRAPEGSGMGQDQDKDPDQDRDQDKEQKQDKDKDKDKEQEQDQGRDASIPFSSIFDLEEDLRIPTEFDNTCRVLFSSVAEDGGDCFSDYSTCCLRAKHIHSIPKAIEHYAHRFKRFPETLFIYFTPPKNAKKGELFDVPFRLEASFLLESSGVSVGPGVGVSGQQGSKEAKSGSQSEVQPRVMGPSRDDDSFSEKISDSKDKARSGSKGVGDSDSTQNDADPALENDSAICIDSNDEYSLEYASEDGFDENQDASLQSDSQDDFSGHKSGDKSPSSDNFFGSSSQYMEKWYSLYGVIIREGDPSGSGSTRCTHQLLIRPEEDGPWFRICDGLVERLVPKIEFTEWKCHGGFFCAAAVYVAEDYIDSIAAGDVIAECDLKAINPELYEETLGLFGMTEEELQYVPSWLPTQVNSSGPSNVHLEVPTPEVDHLAMCVDIANVTMCDSTSCVFGHPMMDAGLSIDPHSLWMLVDYRWGWPRRHRPKVLGDALGHHAGARHGLQGPQLSGPDGPAPEGHLRQCVPRALQNPHRVRGPRGPPEPALLPGGHLLGPDRLLQSQVRLWV
ncbi:MATH-containing protein [Cryptosporidium canis]|uniref:MATH-containing protein n=1 Tax=Cryptosporidium canis TaxID=195482 RepID=A0ABQ8P3V6_9CRYT|nr:MATH-containing protein [Cryptosporidium canis]